MPVLIRNTTPAPIDLGTYYAEDIADKFDTVAASERAFRLRKTKPTANNTDKVFAVRLGVSLDNVKGKPRVDEVIAPDWVYKALLKSPAVAHLVAIGSIETREVSA